MSSKPSPRRSSSATKDGLTLDNRLVAIDQAVIADASSNAAWRWSPSGSKPISPRSPATAAGEVVAGSLSDAVQTRDLWTFRRDISSRDPNWLLVETDEEE